MKTGGVVDLHTHSLLSDGVLVPSELVRRAKEKDYSCIAITDHVDMSNFEQVIEQLLGVCPLLTRNTGVQVIPGVELTHIPPALIPEMVERARAAGAKLILVHGETIVEPVVPGTNHAAIESRVDILAHPGLITPEDVKLAKENGVSLEISGRKGHSLTNGHVAKLAEDTGTELVFGSDTHEPGDLLTYEQVRRVCRGAGLTETGVDKLFENARKLIERLGAIDDEERAERR